MLWIKATGHEADMAELVDATDLKSVGTLLPCRFDSGFPHHKINIHLLVGVFLWLGWRSDCRHGAGSVASYASGRPSGRSEQSEDKWQRHLHSGFPHNADRRGSEPAVRRARTNLCPSERRPIGTIPLGIKRAPAVLLAGFPHHKITGRQSQPLSECWNWNNDGPNKVKMNGNIIHFPAFRSQLRPFLKRTFF